MSTIFCELTHDAIDEFEILEYGTSPDADRCNWMRKDEGDDELSALRYRDNLLDHDEDDSELWALVDDGGRDGARWFPIFVS